jgi:eukaryotic translation initiation factor 2C
MARVYQSARLTRDKMMINIDLSATAFYKGGPLVQIFEKYWNLDLLTIYVGPF